MTPRSSEPVEGPQNGRCYVSEVVECSIAGFITGVMVLVVGLYVGFQPSMTDVPLAALLCAVLWGVTARFRRDRWFLG